MRRKLFSGLAVGIATAALCLTGAGTSHAAARFVGLYHSQLSCQTQGNQLAQQGKLTGFTCVYAGTMQGTQFWYLFAS